MTESVIFGTFITKGMEIEKSEVEKRIFTGHITSEIVDRQNEIIARDEVAKIMDTYMAINPVISDSHSNRMVGKCLSYEKSEIDGHPSIKIKAEIYKHPNITLYDKVWDAIVKGEYAGLSMGGASKTRTPMLQQDGGYVVKLSDLELYEVAVCKTPANQLAIIDKVNTFAKDNHMEDKIQELEDGRRIIKCNSIKCSFEKQSALEQEFGKMEMRKCPSCGKEVGYEMEKCGSCGAEMKKIEQLPVETPRGVNLDNDNDTDNKKPTVESVLGIEKILSDPKLYDLIQKAYLEFNKPFANYENFEACVRANSDKENPQAYCGEIKHKVEDVAKLKKQIEEIEKYLMTEAEHNEHYKPKEQAKEKEEGMTVPSKDKEDDLIKLLTDAIMKNDIRKLLK